jgi:putative nucleotidyltransferase with HDIG domain
MSVTVEIEQLRVGMFIHLDLGWMSHPFPLSSFKITSAEQIETIRSLGIPRLRWSPDRSDRLEGGTLEPSATLSMVDSGEVAAASSAAQAVAARPVDAAQAARRSAAAELEAQASALRICERQFTEACRDLRRINDAVEKTPEKALEGVNTLTRALLAKMLVDGELCVRVLGEPVGDRMSAHAMNVSIISLLLARMMGMAEPDLMDLGAGALLHDMGKIVLPDRLRLPQEDFTAAEQSLYREHVMHGVAHGRRMGLSAGALLVIAQHHELADGSGFPKGALLERMSTAARIVAMVNRYDNLCNAAVPARSLTPHEALSRMFAQSRTKFDVTMLNAFIRMMGIYPPGSVVQLSDDRYAMVMAVNAARPLKPRVLVFDAQVAVEKALHLNLEECPDLGIRRSLKGSQLPPRAAEYLAPRQRVAYFFDMEPASGPVATGSAV